ncbi:MAG: ABC transporter permease [Cycloclasticus sp. symbiont of Bathymodiolus heckerae]|nr:MAG: ABC transporter permease [Cycloclasticus sp. symbiont of Bathymodiolus heckerae]
MLFSDSLFNSLTIITAILYVSGAGLVAVNMLNNTIVNKQRQLVLASALAAAFMHTLLVLHSYNINQMIANDFFSMLSLVFLVISLLFIATAFSQPVETLAIIVFPFSAIAVLLNIGNSIPATTNVNLDSALQVHIILSIVSYSLLSVAAFQAIFVSIQEKQLHDRHPGRFIGRLPSLQLMETLLFRVLSVGLALLTLALATGFIFLDDIFAQHIAHKTVLSILAWLVFATLLWGRHSLGWRGQKAVKWTYGGYFSLMLAYFGSKFVLQLVLNQS